MCAKVSSIVKWGNFKLLNYDKSISFRKLLVTVFCACFAISLIFAIFSSIIVLIFFDMPLANNATYFVNLSFILVIVMLIVSAFSLIYIQIDTFVFVVSYVYFSTTSFWFIESQGRTWFWDWSLQNIAYLMSAGYN